MKYSFKVFCTIIISGLLTGPAMASVSMDKTISGFIGMTYRMDGAVGDDGKYTTFSTPNQTFEGPGLNCSGLVLEISRLMLGKKLALGDVTRDRLGDSGPESPYGHDWDWGWDFIMNISDGTSRRIILPGNKTVDTKNTTGHSYQGFAISDDATWTELIPRLTPGHFYLASFNTHGRRTGYDLMHYHVGIIYLDDNGAPWMYQTTSQGGSVNRRNLMTKAGQQSFRNAFKDNKNNKKYLFIIEVDIPQH